MSSLKLIEVTDFLIVTEIYTSLLVSLVNDASKIKYGFQIQIP